MLQRVGHDWNDLAHNTVITDAVIIPIFQTRKLRLKMEQKQGETGQVALSNKDRIWETAAAAAKSLQSCPTLCDPIDGSPPGSPIPGILQARTLEGVAISFSNAGKWKVKVKLLSRVRPFVTPWTAAYQAPPSMATDKSKIWWEKFLCRIRHTGALTTGTHGIPY